MHINIHSLKRTAVLTLSVLLTCFSVGFAHSQDDDEIEPAYDFNLFDKLDVDYQLSPHSSDLLGDMFDNGSGTIRFEYLDVSLPGNFNIEVAYRRAYNTVGPNPMFDPRSQEIPRMEYQVTDVSDYWPRAFQDEQHCSGQSYLAKPIIDSEPFGGGSPIPVIGSDQFNFPFKLIIPGQINEEVFFNEGALPISTGDYRFTTKSKWRIKCIPQADGVGEGFAATSPEGTTYTLDVSYLSDRGAEIDGEWSLELSQMIFAVSKVEDRFGNWVLYNRDNEGKLTSITSSDNRTITLSYRTDDRVSKVTANGREWLYEWDSLDGSPTSSERFPSKVTRPDGKSWEYDLGRRTNNYKQVNRHSDPRSCGLGGTGGGSVTLQGVIVNMQGTGALPASPTYTVTHPDGATGRFWLGYLQQGRTNLETDVSDGEPTNSQCSYEYSLLKKEISGPGLDTLTWLYEYSAKKGLLAPNALIPSFRIGGVTPDMLLTGSLPSNIDSLNYKWVKVIQPDGGYVKSYINRDASQLFSGSVFAEEYFSATGTKLKEVQNTYVDGTIFGAPILHTVERDEKNAQTPKLIKTETTLFDAGGSTTYTRETTSFDSYDVPTVRYEHNDFSNDQRYIRTAYYNDTTNWVLSQRTTSELSSNGTNYTTFKEATYHSATSNYKSLPNCLFSFGREFSCNTSYLAEGNVQRTEFNLADRWIEYANYKRGLPQTRTLPGRYQASNNISRTYVVDDNGWIEQITDFNGNTTNYGYDGIGRITLIDPVNPEWANTNISYQDVSSGDLSIPASQLSAGQLKQTVSQGSYEKTTYHDAWLRPTLVRERDTSDSSTTRYTNHAYNFNNQPVFTSYPSASAGEDSGTRTDYDVLGRVTATTETATNSSVTQTYLSDNKIRTTDLSGNATTTSYMAYGYPRTQLATQISSPESVTTTINYNLFNNITSASQGGITSNYVYDSYQLLCKMTRPETGSTYYDYNNLYEAIWSAQGVSSSTSTCDRSAVPAAQRVTVEYDNLGSAWKSQFPDSTADQISTLDNSGNLLSLSSGGADWSYTYNSRNLIETQTLSINAKSFQLSLAYDNVGNLSSLVYPSNRVVDFATNGLGQATTVGDFVTSANYHPNGTTKTISYGNGTTYTTSLNDRQLPRDMYVQAPDLTMLSDFYYTYDNNANVTRIQDNVDTSYTIDMQYDGLDRLTEADGYWGQGSFSYDALGNILNKDLGSQTLTYLYDNQNRLDEVTGSNPYTFNYDPRGNVTNNGNRSFIYNLANQMTGSDGITYEYDGYNRRVRKTLNGDTDYSIYSSDGTLYYRQKANGDHVDYLYLGGRLVTTVESR